MEFDTARPYTYTVKPGDSLARIGAKFGVPWRDIAAENGIQQAPDGRWYIHPGNELRIPGKWASAPANGASGTPDYVLVTDVAAGHRWARPNGVRPLFLIVHDPVAASMAGLMTYMSWNSRQVGYDYILEDGAPPKIHVLSDDRTWVGQAGYGSATDVVTGHRYGKDAGGNLNLVSEGLCLFKTASDNGPFPVSMVAAAAKFAADWLRARDIPVQNLLSHHEVDPARRHDPRGLDMARFRGLVANEMAWS